ncbi:MAG: SMP-30/gluconolactonase/LRE family protein [Clostridia bacterium]|nr:SMP-30/gluconolactonase/LRE family protein [Clostridia bacterium]
MEILTQKRAIIGEGPIWNEVEQKLYYTNGFEKEICVYDFLTKGISAIKLSFGVSAIAFDKQNNLIVAHNGGVDILNKDGTLRPIYNKSKYSITNCNDMKVSPNGDIYVGTISTKRKVQNDSELNGKLYKISANGTVTMLLDNLSLSNGLDWSIDETKFYHTDSDKSQIKEYNYVKETGEIIYTGRSVIVNGVDGLTISKNGNIYASCWARGFVAVIDTAKMELIKTIKIPCQIPTSCAFCGPNLDLLAVTTASFNQDITIDKNAGFTLIANVNAQGRKPYRFGEKND